MDYQSHPSEIVAGGKVNNVGIKDLKDAIPAHCFKPSYFTSFMYLISDLTLAAALMMMATTSIPLLPQWVLLRFLAWMAYGFVQGCVGTGIWILGHECGHSAFSPNDMVNDIVGFILHTALMTPYFSWKSTHRRHHIYANNMVKDHNYVPPHRDSYAKSLLFDVSRLEELTEDAPLFTFLRIVLQQLVGWPWYLLVNITAADTSMHGPKSDKAFGNSHFNPFGPLFRKDERLNIILTDIGLVLMGTFLWIMGQRFGSANVFLLYVVPYMWVNHWIVAVTYLHHTHPQLPKYSAKNWSFIKGATATVDREFGFIGKHMFHGIIEFHVIHHLFSRIPFYHAEEATKAIIPLLGEQYHSEKNEYFFWGLWESFTKCQWVEPGADGTLWYKGGSAPPVEIQMGSRIALDRIASGVLPSGWQ